MKGQVCDGEDALGAWLESHLKSDLFHLVATKVKRLNERVWVQKLIYDSCTAEIAELIMGEVKESEVFSPFAIHASRNQLAYCGTTFASFKTIVTEIDIGEVLVIV